MNKPTKTYFMQGLWSLILVVITGITMMFLLKQTGLPAERIRLIRLAWLFPLMNFVYSVLPFFTTDRFQKQKALRINQWFTLWVVPFVLLGVSWAHFGSWQAVFSGFYWVYLVSHMSLLMIFRQPVGRSKKLGPGDFVILVSGMLALNCWRLTSLSFSNGFEMLTNAVLTVLAAMLTARLSERFAANSYAGSIWQRWLIVLTMLSAPFLATMNHVTIYHLFFVAVTFGLLLIRSNDKNALLSGFALSGVIIALLPIAIPSGVVLSIWLSCVIYLRNRKKQVLEGILVPGAVLTLLLIGIFISVVRYGGSFSTGDRLYSFSFTMNLAGPFLDRSHGLFLVMPWVFLAVAGWLITVFDRKPDQLIYISGAPLVFISLTVWEWLRSGRLPDWYHWLILLSVMLPFYGAVFRKPMRGATRSLIRVAGMLSVLLSGIIYCYLCITDALTVDLAQITADFAANTSIDLTALLPSFTFYTPVYSAAKLIWFGGFTLLVFYITALVRLPSNRKRANESVYIDLLYLTVIILAAATGVRTVQRWHNIPLEKQILIVPGQSWSIDNPVDRKVTALRVVSDLSRSTHLPHGHPVANVTFHGKSGETFHQELLAGVHTAEWAYNRPDVMRNIRHQKPDVAWSWKVEEADGYEFSGSTYQGVLFLETPARIERIDITNPETHETGHVVSIKALGVMIEHGMSTWTRPVNLIDTSSVVLSVAEPMKQFSLSEETAFSHITIHSVLTNASHLKNGHPVGQISIRRRERIEDTWTIRAGIETAEWSWSRPDMTGKIRHNKPKVVYSERKTDYPVPYFSHIYRGKRRIHPPVYATDVIIEYTLSDGNESEIEWRIETLAFR
jgi:hypothetical protein